MREDVYRFSGMMSEVMNSKHIERESHQEPAYSSKDYQLAQALNCMQDKVDQLIHWVKRANADDVVNHLPDEHSARIDAKERARATAIHLANFAMIVEYKVTHDHILKENELVTKKEPVRIPKMDTNLNASADTDKQTQQKCLGCHKTNPGTAKFCMECGSKLG